MNIYSILGLVISTLSIIFCIATFVRNGRKDAQHDTANEQYKFGKLDQQLKNIFEKLDKIEAKLDSYDKEIDIKIEKAMEHHIREYHSTLSKN